jgi:hypothetical protein
MNMFLRVAAACALAISLSACASSSRPPPPAAPVLFEPLDAVPADLDVAVRVDVARLRAALGTLLFAGLRRVATAGIEADGTSDYLLLAIEKSDLAVFAFRPELEGAGVDGVLVLRGKFEKLDPRDSKARPPWQSPRDLGGAVRRYDRDQPAERGAPARIYARGDEMLVIVSAAEIDSVELRVERQQESAVVRPPARGVIAFAARLRAFRLPLHQRFPLVAELLEDAREVHGVVEFGADGASFELSLPFESEAAAESAKTGIAGVLKAFGERGAGEGVFSAIAKRTSAERAGAHVVLRVSVPIPELGALLLPSLAAPAEPATP